VLLHIVRKELLDQLLSLRFAIACGVCLLVFLLSSIVLTRDYREAMSTYNMNKVMHRNELQQRTQVWSLSEGVTVERPLNIMNTLVRGLSKELTESVRVRSGNRLEFPEGWERNPVLALFPAVDFVFIVGIIMSLLALAFSHDAVSGEAESGVLKLLMSYSVPRDLVLLGKWIGGFLALIAPFVVSFVLALIVILLFPEVQPTLDSCLAIVALFALALLYLAAIYSLGLFVSCRTRLASTSITVLLLVWVVLILAIPNMAPYAVGQFVSIPSREEIDREKQAKQGELSQKFQRFVEREKERLGTDNIWQDEDFQKRQREMGEKSAEEIQKIEDSFLKQVNRQTRLSRIIARLSPLTSFNLAAFDLAVAGIAQEREYVKSLNAFSSTWQEYAQQKQKAWREFMERRRSGDGSVTFNSADMDQFNKLDLSDAPRFDFSFMPIGDRLWVVSGDLLLLALWNVAFFMLAYLSFLRYPVE
jgi:ABC-type transport system involved in multi-copper enzyme maturation permease subunit